MLDVLTLEFGVVVEQNNMVGVGEWRFADEIVVLFLWQNILYYWITFNNYNMILVQVDCGQKLLRSVG